MALPGSRDFDAVDSGPLPSATVNNIQDAIIGRGHGSIDQFVDMNAVRQQGMTIDSGEEWYEFVGVEISDQIRFVLPLRPGDRLIEWAVYIRDDPGPIDRIQAQILQAVPLTGWTLTTIGGAQISDGSGTDQKIGEVLGAPHVVLVDKPVDMRISSDPAGALSAGNTMRIYPVFLMRWDHP